MGIRVPGKYYYYCSPFVLYHFVIYRKLATGKPLEGIIQRSFLEANAMIEKENGKPFNIVPVVSLMVYNVVASMVFGKT